MSKKEVQPEPPQPEIRLQAFCYAERDRLLPELGAAIAAAGGWVLERRPLSAATVEVRVEMAFCSLPCVYGALLASGLHFTRDSHRVLTERCNCDLHRRPLRGLTAYLLVFIELHFPPAPGNRSDPLRQLPPNGTRDR